jgi:ferredoxin
MEDFSLKYQIEVNREDCIRCGSCYGLDPAHFESDSDGKSQVVGGTTNGKSMRVFDDEKMVEAQAAVDACPVSVITVTKVM